MYATLVDGSFNYLNIRLSCMVFFRRKEPKKPTTISTFLNVSTAIPLKASVEADIAALDFLREIRKGLKIKIILDHHQLETLRENMLEGKTIRSALEERHIKFEPLPERFEYDLLKGIKTYLSANKNATTDDLFKAQKELVGILYDHLSQSLSHQTASQTLCRYFPTLFSGQMIPHVKKYYCLKPEKVEPCLKNCLSFLDKHTPKQPNISFGRE